MFEQFKKLAGHSAVYGLAVVGSTIGMMICTPMFLHHLNRSEYGMNEILNVLASMIFVVANLGISAVFIKVYINDCKNEGERKQMFSSMLVFAVALTVFMVLLTTAVARPVSSLLFKQSHYGNLVRLATTASAMQLIMAVIMQSLRAKEWAVKFVIVNLIQFAVVILLNLYFMLVRHMGVFGIQLAALLCNLAAVLVGLFVLRADLVLRFSGRIVKTVLLTSLPVLPSSIAPWILNVSDRYFLNGFCGLSDTGLYAAGYKVGMIGVFTVMNAVGYAWPTIFYANSDSEDAPRLCANVLKYYLVVLAAVALAFSVFSPEIVRVIAKREYWDAYRIVPYIAGAYVLYAVQFYTIPLFIRANRGKALSIIMGGAAAGNLLLNLLLIPHYGIWGAVASTVITFSAETAVSVWYATNLFAVPHEFANLAKVIVLTGLVFLAFRHIEAVSWGTFLLKSVSFPTLVILLFLTRFFKPRELALMRAVLGTAAGKLLPGTSKVA